MSWNPLKTLTGRMVLVTIVAVALSYALAAVLLANERGAALRRAAETALIERVVFTVERLQLMPAERRAEAAYQLRDFGMRYSVTRLPEVESAAPMGPRAKRIAEAISQRLNGANLNVMSRVIEARPRRWRLRNEEPAGFGPRRRDVLREAGLVHNTEVRLSVRLDAWSWLNVNARLPGPRPPPLSVLGGGLFAVLAVGFGAALVSRQIGRPLAELAAAARALGSGESNVSAPVSGPEDVRRASTAFNAMAARLGRQLNRQRQMLWALSHDLRTPITAIRLRAELIEDESERLRLLASIGEMERLTEQALALARAGASEESRVNVDIAEIVRTLCGELQDMGLAVSADAPAPVFALCRPAEIARAARNIAENAAKYAGAGVMHAYRDASGEAVIEVTDDGPGVPEALLAQLTAPFFRADSARSAAEGAGLGLAIAQAIAEAQGGRLVIANRAPRGLSVKLVLPA